MVENEEIIGAKIRQATRKAFMTSQKSLESVDLAIDTLSKFDSSVRKIDTAVNNKLVDKSKKLTQITEFNFAKSAK